MPRLLRASLLTALFALAHSAGVSAAELHYPLAVAAAANGTIYVADGRDATNPAVLWKIADGKLEVVFAASKKYRTPLNALRCVAVDAKGRVVVGDTATREIYRFGDDNKPEPLTKGANAGIGMPMAITFDSKGDIYVADLEEPQQIVKVPEAGGQAVKFVEVPAPRGLAMDPQDRLWVVSAVSGKTKLLRVASSGEIEPVVKEGVFNLPHQVALDNDGNAYVADNYAHCIWKVSSEGKAEKFAEGAPLDMPVGVAWQKDRLLVADPHAKAIFSISADGKAQRLEFRNGE